MIITDAFNVVIYQPLYNALVALVNVIPGGNIGVAVILLTLLVKAAILPISHKSVKTQSKIRKLDPEIKDIKAKTKNNQQEQAAKIMALYKEHGVNPFSGCLFAFIQIPLIFGLYWVLWRGLESGIDPSVLYSFVTLPEMVNFTFLGFIDLTERNILFALIAGVSQYYLMRYSLPPTPKKDESKGKKVLPENFAEEFKKSLGTQARYVLPLIIGVISLSFPAVVPLYWITSNVFSLAHELLVKRKADQLTQLTA